MHPGGHHHPPSASQNQRHNLIKATPQTTFLLLLLSLLFLFFHPSPLDLNTLPCLCLYSAPAIGNVSLVSRLSPEPVATIRTSLSDHRPPARSRVSEAEIPDSYPQQSVLSPVTVDGKPLLRSRLAFSDALAVTQFIRADNRFA